MSCVSPKLDSNAGYQELIFGDNLTFDEFNDLLIKYVGQSSYPNIGK